MTVKKTSDTDKRLGALIRAKRLQLGMSLEILAQAAGVTYQQMQKYEAGKNRITVARLIDIAEALNVPSSFFLPPPLP